MRLILWAPVLAAVAEALPGVSSRPASSSASSTSTPSSTSTASSTSESSNPVPTPIRDDIWKKVCQSSGGTWQDWVDMEMGYWLNTTSNLWCEDKEKCPYGEYANDWPHTIARLLPEDTVWDCQIGYDTCNPSINFNEKYCNDTQMAKVTFALTAVQHFHDWSNAVYEVINDAAGDYSNLQVKIYSTFSTHDVSQDNSRALGFTYAAAGFAILAALLGPLGAIGALGEAGAVTAATMTTAGMSGFSGALSGYSTLGIAASNTNPKNTAEVLQKELDGIANVSLALVAGINATRDAIVDMSANAINKVPDNRDGSTGYQYANQPGSAPAVLNSGRFAERLDPWDKTQLLHSTQGLFGMTAVAEVWRTYEWVYIAKLTKDILGTNPCDVELDDLYRTCKDGVAYFYVLWKDRAKTDKNWGQPKGLDSLDEFPWLDTFQMAKSAEWNQATNGYDHSFDPSAAADFLLNEEKLEDTIMINLPVCYLDNDADFYASHKDSFETNVKAALHHGCAGIPKAVKYWPYPSHGKGITGSTNANPYRDDAQDSVVTDDDGRVTWGPGLTTVIDGTGDDS